VGIGIKLRPRHAYSVTAILRNGNAGTVLAYFIFGARALFAENGEEFTGLSRIEIAVAAPRTFLEDQLLLGKLKMRRVSVNTATAPAHASRLGGAIGIQPAFVAFVAIEGILLVTTNIQFVMTINHHSNRRRGTVR
jgi:hypothetical protein